MNTGYFGGIAIMGYDSVSYFTEARAVKGSPDFSHEFLGETWHFASAENRDTFAADPVSYAPQFGEVGDRIIAHDRDPAEIAGVHTASCCNLVPHANRSRSLGRLSTLDVWQVRLSTEVRRSAAYKSRME